MKEFIDLYYPQVFSAISRLTRLSDRQDLETLTEDVLADLWQQKEAFDAEPRQGIFMYKTILRHVLAFLEKIGDDQRIDFLRRTLPINSGFLRSPSS